MCGIRCLFFKFRRLLQISSFDKPSKNKTAQCSVNRSRRDRYSYNFFLLFNLYFTICSAGHSVNLSSYLYMNVEFIKTHLLKNNYIVHSSQMRSFKYLSYVLLHGTASQKKVTSSQKARVLFNFFSS